MPAKPLSTEEEIQLLKDRVAILEDALGITRRFPPDWGLTPRQEQMLGILCKTTVAPAERFMVALYSDYADPPVGNIIATQLCKLRKRLKPMGIEIKSRLGGGYGYWIPAEQKAKLAAFH